MKPSSSAPIVSPSAITGATISVFGRIVPSAPVISSFAGRHRLQMNGLAIFERLTDQPFIRRDADAGRMSTPVRRSRRSRPRRSHPVAHISAPTLAPRYSLMNVVTALAHVSQ